VVDVKVLYPPESYFVVVASEGIYKVAVVTPGLSPHEANTIRTTKPKPNTKSDLKDLSIKNSHNVNYPVCSNLMKENGFTTSEDSTMRPNGYLFF